MRVLYCLLRHNLWHLYYSALSSGAPLSGRIHSMPAYLKKTNHTNFLNVVPGPCNVEMIFSFYQVCSVFNLNLILLKGLLDKCIFFTTRGNFRKYDLDRGFFLPPIFRIRFVHLSIFQKDFPGCIFEVLKGRKTYISYLNPQSKDHLSLCFFEWI